MKYSIGTADAYYNLNLTPQIYCDGVDGSIDTPLQVLGDYTFTWSGRFDPVQDYRYPYILRASDDFDSGVFIYLGDIDSVAKTARLRTTLRGGGNQENLNLDNIPTGIPAEIYVNVTGRTVTVSYNNITVSKTFGFDFDYNPNFVRIMASTATSRVTRGDVYSFSLDTAGQKVEYIKRGDQNSGTVIPSHPAGYDCTLIGGAKWEYDEIEENYIDQATFIADVTTATEPVDVLVLDRAEDISDIPSTIDGQPVTISYLKRRISKMNRAGFWKTFSAGTPVTVENLSNLQGISVEATGTITLTDSAGNNTTRSVATGDELTGIYPDSIEATVPFTLYWSTNPGTLV